MRALLRKLLPVVLVFLGLFVAAQAFAAPDAGPVPTPAAVSVPDPASPNFFTDVFQGVSTGNWRFVAASILVLVVIGARRLFSSKLDKGKWAWTLTVGLGAAGAVLTLLLSTLPLSASGVVGAVLQGAFLGLASAGGYKGLKEWMLDK